MKIATEGKAQYNKTAHTKCIDLWKDTTWQYKQNYGVLLRWVSVDLS
jgi:hypothetical protein